MTADVSTHSGIQEWTRVSDKTRIVVRYDRIVIVETSEFSLGKALDDAEKFWGEPIEQTGPWVTEDGVQLNCAEGSPILLTCAVTSNMRDETTVPDYEEKQRLLSRCRP